MKTTFSYFPGMFEKTAPVKIIKKKSKIANTPLKGSVGDFSCFSVNSSIVSYKQEMCNLYRENTNENKQFEGTKTWISNSYLIRQS